MKLYKKGIIIDKTDDISDIYYCKLLNEYFLQINKIHNLNINILIHIDNDSIKNLYIKGINKACFIYENEDENVSINICDTVNNIYNTNGDRIFFSNFINNILNSDIENNRPPSPIIPFGVMR